MAIVNRLVFTKKQLTGFAKLFFTARVSAGLTQLQVAQQAFHYKLSHCKVSRIERAVMTKVDALAIERMAEVFGIPVCALESIDPEFKARKAITKIATDKGFWNHPAAMLI